MDNTKKNKSEAHVTEIFACTGTCSGTGADIHLNKDACAGDNGAGEPVIKGGSTFGLQYVFPDRTGRYV